MSIVMALVNSIGASHLMPFRLRTLLLLAAGVRMDIRGKVSPGVIIRTNALTMGRRSTINYRCIIDNREQVTIGKNVGIGIGVSLITSSHEFDDRTVRAGQTLLAPIKIGDGAWVGSGVTILSGVCVGEGSVIAAGAVVTKDCEPNSLYAGIPARFIRSLDQEAASAQRGSTP